MTKLDWNASGTRLYEAGVDRAVLYPKGKTGVAWNGFIGVTQSPSGGEANPYYLDGIMYMNVIGTEDFGGSIKAYTYPNEFEECDGTKQITPGLSVSQQKRLPFSLSYRTGLGNDLKGLEFAYRIHLVYNASAEPSSSDYQTLGDEIDPMEFDWNFTTKPARAKAEAKLLPLSHVVVDSRDTPIGVLRAIEKILYGTDAVEPRMPTLDELIQLYIDRPVSLLTIPDYDSGLSQQIEVEEGDLDGIITEGLYSTTPTTRLVSTGEDGFWVLEATEDDPEKYIWVVRDNEEFPAEAADDELGYDPDSGNVWRNEIG